MNSTIKNDIIRFDEVGLIPTKRVKTLDEHLRQAERDLETLQTLQTNPESYIPKIGNFKLVYCSKEIQEEFYKRFLTKIRPGISADRDFTKIRESQMTPISKWVNKTTQFGKVDGTIYNLGTKENPIQVSLISESEKSSRNNDTLLAHEMVHCIRNSWNTSPKSHFAEETLAYCCLDKNEKVTNIMLRTFPVIHAGITMFIPVTAIAAIAYAKMSESALIGTGLAYAGILLKEAIYGRKTANFFNRASEEGLNPYYLFTHSEPGEYSQSCTITEQLQKSTNPRFQIMATRLGLI